MLRYIEQGQIAGIITTVACRGKTVHLEKYDMMDVEAQTLHTTRSVASVKTRARHNVAGV
jgi:hypothetical protein